MAAESISACMNRGRVGWLVVMLLIVGCEGTSSSTTMPTSQQAEISGRIFHWELACTDQTRYQGLSDRKEIPADGGMLFVFPQPRKLTFVMRRCLTPIDVIFLDAAGNVDSWHEMPVEPYAFTDEQLKLYHSDWPCQFAVELRGGTVRELHLKVGQKLVLPWANIKRLAK